MSKSYTYPEFPYRQSAAQREGRVERHALVVIGAGPIGLSVALDCAQRGIDVRLLDDNNTVSVGSRAVCYAKRPLEIWDRLGCAKPMVEKGCIGLHRIPQPQSPGRQGRHSADAGDLCRSSR